MLDRLETLHSLNLIHNDIKLENLVIGRSESSRIYLIDYGLVETFLTEQGTHKLKCFMKKFSGNFLFASLNSCRGFNKSRRDDIESLFYLLIYLLNDSKLPWSDFD